MTISKAWLTVAGGSMVLFVCALISALAVDDLFAGLFFAMAVLGWTSFLAIVISDTRRAVIEAEANDE